ncbi:MAG TPA: hypothetical protein PKZ56_01155 [Candidatus Paceibacterota bacterium]|nr:hypothetical protein [Candidatus Paceibacterota bacterium]
MKNILSALGKIALALLDIILKILQAFGIFAAKHPVAVATVVGLLLFTYLLLTNYAFQVLVINVGGLALVIAFLVWLFKNHNSKPNTDSKKKRKG